MKERKLMGLRVFFLGLGFLCFTFYLAYSVFTGPELLSRFYHLVPSEWEGSPILGIFKVVVCFVAIGLLWVMGSIGVRIIKVGLDLHSSKSS